MHVIKRSFLQQLVTDALQSCLWLLISTSAPLIPFFGGTAHQIIASKTISLAEICDITEYDRAEHISFFSLSAESSFVLHIYLSAE